MYERITIRLSREQYARITAEAERRGIRVSALLRELLRGALHDESYP